MRMHAETPLKLGAHAHAYGHAPSCMQELERRLQEAKANLSAGGACKQPSSAGASEAALPSTEPANVTPLIDTVAMDVGAAVHQANDVQTALLDPEESDDSLREGIRRCLHDPGFAAYVDRVEALWAEMEHEVLDEMEA